MAPLLILLLTYSLLFLLNRYAWKSPWERSYPGRLALSIMLLFTGLAHFIQPELMVAMLPGGMPLKKAVVYGTGILEWMAAVGLLYRPLSRITGFCLIAFFFLVLPANVIGSLKHVPLGGMEKGAGYLYFRIPLQLFFIGWTYVFSILWNKGDTK